MFGRMSVFVMLVLLFSCNASMSGPDESAENENDMPDYSAYVIHVPAEPQIPTITSEYINYEPVYKALIKGDFFGWGDVSSSEKSISHIHYYLNDLGDVLYAINIDSTPNVEGIVGSCSDTDSNKILHPGVEFTLDSDGNINTSFVQIGDIEALNNEYRLMKESTAFTIHIAEHERFFDGGIQQTYEWGVYDGNECTPDRILKAILRVEINFDVPVNDIDCVSGYIETGNSAEDPSVFAEVHDGIHKGVYTFKGVSADSPAPPSGSVMQIR